MRRTDGRRDFIKAAGAGSLGTLPTSGWGATQSADRLGPERWLVEVGAGNGRPNGGVGRWCGVRR
jgi:hypothetical protein